MANDEVGAHMGLACVQAYKLSSQAHDCCRENCSSHVVLCCCSRGMLGWIVLILVVWVFINWTATYFALSKLNYLKR